MLISRIIKLGVTQPKLLVPVALFSHSNTCRVKNRRPVCPGTSPSKSPGGLKSTEGDNQGLKRALRSGKCRFGFIPDEWFNFFWPITGVTGPYFFMLGVGNYLVSKEVYVMEHEYYMGLSVTLVLYLITTKLGPQIGAFLDKEVDALANALQKSRDDDLAFHKKLIEDAKLAQWRAEGQKGLMEAKKENIAMQLEAIYRDRLMMVYEGVKDRLDYHVKRHRTQRQIQTKWMINWILENVQKSITPEFKKQALASALKDLEVMASHTK